MKAPGFLLAVLAAAIVCAPAALHAQCLIKQFGIDYLDSDCDQIVDNTDMNDADHDGVPDGEWVDNCRYAPNGACSKDVFFCDADESCLDPNAPPNCTPTQKEMDAGYQMDWNNNGVGDACDDSDNDGVLDYLDNCKSLFNPNQGVNDCADSDKDFFEDTIDNCPYIYNPKQEDTDKDGVGDWCDNCRMVYNPAQNITACPGGSGSTNNGTANPPSPSESPTAGDATVTGGPEQGPEQIKGNGFSDGGCTLCASEIGSPYAAVILLLAGLLVLRFRRT